MEQKEGQTIVFNLSEEPGEQPKSTNDQLPSSSSATKSENINSKKPTCLIILGMAGSGKTTFVQRLVSHLNTKANDKHKLPYVVNLDPACIEVSSVP